MKIHRQYLIVRGNGAMRLRASRPSRSDLRPDELAFPLEVSIPDRWGRLSEQVIALTFPENPEPSVDVSEPQGIT